MCKLIFHMINYGLRERFTTIQIRQNMYRKTKYPRAKQNIQRRTVNHLVETYKLMHTHSSDVVKYQTYKNFLPHNKKQQNEK